MSELKKEKYVVALGSDTKFVLSKKGLKKLFECEHQQIVDKERNAIIDFLNGEEKE